MSDIDNKKILVTGGAGYIGSVLVRLLLAKGYEVRVLDSLHFGGESIVDLLSNDNFEFIKGDVRDQSTLKKSVKGVDYIAHLSAIVGDPACLQKPELAKETNLDASKHLYEIAKKAGVKRFVFASTCSNYGKMDDPDQYVTEDSTLAPISLYAQTKVSVEKYLMNHKNGTIDCVPTSLRFSTVYGLSPRPRFDLTVNEFTKEVAQGNELLIYGEQFWRPYCHVTDLARSVVEVFQAPKQKVAFNVFNVGDTDENYTKHMLVNEIKKQIPEAKIKYVKKDEDPRDYKVNFDKIKQQLGFEITKNVSKGIAEIRQAVTEGLFKNPDDPGYKNIS